MRQPLNDFRVDPFKPHTSAEIELPQLSDKLLAHKKKYTYNLAVFSSHKFCSKTCFDLNKPDA